MKHPKDPHLLVRDLVYEQVVPVKNEFACALRPGPTEIQLRTVLK